MGIGESSGTFSNDAGSGATAKGVLLVLSHFVAKVDDSVLVGFDFQQMERNILFDFIEEWNSVANQDWNDRVTKLVGQSEAKAFGGNVAASNKPDGLERRPQAIGDECREIT